MKEKIIGQLSSHYENKKMKWKLFENYSITQKKINWLTYSQQPALANKRDFFSVLSHHQSNKGEILSLYYDINELVCWVKEWACVLLFFHIQTVFD